MTLIKKPCLRDFSRNIHSKEGAMSLLKKELLEAISAKEFSRER